ncbi:MAG: GMC family oxidoreductase N-terminal domain-containing protein [Actinomycetota bacterium]
MRVIVVGAGAGGAVMAGRAAEAGHDVTLVEAGPHAPGPLALRRGDATEALAVTDWFWSSSRFATSGGAVGDYRLGRGVGGGTAVNTLALTAGDSADYARWGDRPGMAMWGSTTVAAALARVRATLAPVPVAPGPFSSAFTELAERSGFGRGGASTGLDSIGVVPISAPVDGRGARRTAADAYLTPAVEVRAGAPVDRIVLSRGRARGVDLLDGTRLDADAVVVAAGAVHSPRLLARSGAGLAMPRPVADHPSASITVGLRPGGQSRVDPVVPPIATVLRWRSDAEPGVEPASGQPPEGGADLMALVMDHVGPGRAGRRYGAVIVMLTDPRSTGRLSSASFDPGWLRHGDDRRRLAAGIARMAGLLADPELGDVIDGAYLDDQGTTIASVCDRGPTALEQWVAATPGPVTHATSTLALGHALSPDGSVPGWPGLSVADASTLPTIPNANPQLPIMAVAETLAEVRCAEWG